MEITYETAMAELQNILKELEEGTTSVDDLSAKVKRAAELVKWCQEKLRLTQEDVDNLLK